MLNNDSSPHPIFIIAGEVSGDMFASQLMSQIKKQGNFSFVGCGGSHMVKQSLIPITDDNSLLSTIGLLEATGYLYKHWGILKSIIPAIQKHNCKHIILVDHEVFNIMVAQRIRKTFGNSVKIYFFIPPRVSMWGSKSAPVIAKLCDALFCYMEPDLEIYKQYNPNSFFFGNPLSKKLKTFLPDPNFFTTHNLTSNKKYLTLLPGSRKQEIKELFPVFLKTALRLYSERNIEFLMTIAHPGLKKQILKEIKKIGLDSIIHIIDSNSLEIMNHTQIGLVSAGTCTLEAVMMNMYPIITYKVSNFTFNTIKKTEQLGDHTLIGLPNVFLQKRIFPELVQFEITPERLYQEIIYALDMNPESFKYLMTNARELLSEKLGSSDSIKLVADYIVKDIGN